MKLLIKSSTIYAMAINRRSAVDKLDSIRPTLEEHIMKIAVYDNQLNCKDHWIQEIANYLSDANNLTIKSPSGKLSSKDYAEHLVGGLGNTKKDASVNVGVFRAVNMRSKEYPNFEVTDDIVERAFNISQVVSEFTVNMLPTKNSFTRKDIYYYLKNHIEDLNATM